MPDIQPTSIELRMPSDPQLLRVLRLVGSGLASLGHLDLAGTEEVRLAIDELGASLIALGDGGPIDLTFELTLDALCIQGVATLPDGASLDIDPLTDRVMEAVASSHSWTLDGRRAVGRVEKHLTRPG